MSIFKKGFAAMGRRKRRERGIALIFTLGILGLLTVLALGFASTAMLNSKISGNISHQQKARYIARLGAERALYALTQCPDIPISNIFSKSAVDIDKESCDGIWKLNTKLNGIPIYEITDDYGADSVGWEYIRDPQSVTEEDIKKDIIGRYAYVVVEETGKLDPSVHLTDVASLSRQGGKNIADELSFKVPFGTDFFPNTSDSPYSQNDTKLANLFKGAGQFQTKFSRRLFNLGNLLEYKVTDSDGKLTTAIKQLGFTTSQEQAKLKRALKSILGSRLEPYQECYTLSSTSTSTESDGSTTTKTTTNTYPRFNLNRSDWESLTPEDLVNLNNLSKGKAIAWLVNWMHSRGDDWDDKTMAKQIAANIIQYSLPMNKETVSDSSNWVAQSPTYAGVGRHPMLNEIRVKLNIHASVETVSAGENTTEYKPKYTIDAEIGTELIDMFGLSEETLQKKVKVSIYGEFTFNYTKTEVTNNNGVDTYTWKDGSYSFGGQQTLLCEINFFDTDTKDTWTKGYIAKLKPEEKDSPVIPEDEGKGTISLTPFKAASGKETEIYKDMKIKNVRLNISKVILTYDDNPRDYAQIQNTSGQLTVSGVNYDTEHAMSDSASREYSFQAAWQAVDPRVNHYPIDWTLKLSDPTAETVVYPGTWGINNFDNDSEGKLDAVTEGDKEAVSDPAWTSSGHLASAYIRHAPMESLWELGCISRAEPWKTLNLKKSRVFASGETQGGGEYAKGDANILDQVTLTDKKSRFGLINLNTDEHFVLETLFYQIPFHTELHQAGIGADDKSILGATGTSSIYPVYSKKDTPHHKEDSCLACLIMKRTEILRFEKRSDLLMDETEVDALTTIDSEKKLALKETVTKLRTALFSIPKTGGSASSEEETSSNTTDAEEEQLTGKIMNLVAAEPYETIYIIAVGQSIRDIGSSDNKGITIFKNWAGSGKADKTYKDNAVTKGNDAYKAYRRAGYIRPFTLKEIEDGDATSPKVLNGAPNQLEDKITGVKKGQYDLGADKISAESKIVMTLCFDPWDKKWKIKRFEYVE